MQTPNLHIDYLTTAQSQKELTINTAFQKLDAAIAALQATAGTGGGGGGETPGDISTLQAQIDTLKSDVALLKAADTVDEQAISTLIDRCATIEGAATTLANRTTALENRAGVIESAATSLTTRVGTNETDISGLKTRAGNIETAATSLTTRVATLESAPAGGSSGTPVERSIIITRAMHVGTNYPWTVPAGVTRVKICAWGAGASGSSGQTTAGGGAGAYGETITTVEPGAVLSCYVGAKGAKAATTNQPGANGGNTSVVYSGGTTAIPSLTAGGGSASSAGSGGTGTGGIATNFQLGITGEDGQQPYTNAGTGAVWGGSGGSAPRGGMGGRGMETRFPGVAGGFPGGGGGTSAAASGGNGFGGDGADGLVIIYY